MNRLRVTRLRTTEARRSLFALLIFSSLISASPAYAGDVDSLQRSIDDTIKRVADIQAGNESPTRAVPDPTVSQAQALLGYMSYYEGPLDGLLTAETISAVKAYQSDNDLVADGIVTAELATMMRNSAQQVSQAIFKPKSAATDSNQPQTEPSSNVDGDVDPVSGEVISRNPPMPRQDSAEVSTQPGPAPGTSADFVLDASRAAPAAQTSTGADGLTIPSRWSTVENGIVVPHPVTVNGRLLSVSGIDHYAKWMGLSDPDGAKHALAEYLQLVSLAGNPDAIARIPLKFALYLSEDERSKYLCWVPSPSCSSEVGEIVWTGSNEFEKRRSIQSFTSDYRDRFLAVTPTLPVELLDIGEARFSAYDTRKSGFQIASSIQYYDINFEFAPGQHHTSKPSMDYSSVLPKFKFRRKSEAPSNFFALGVSEFVSMEISTAESFIQQLWPEAEQERKVVTRFHQTITGIDITPPPVTAPFIAKVRVTSAVAYQDAMFVNEVYRFGLDGQGLVANQYIAEPQAVAAAPASVPRSSKGQNSLSFDMIEAAAGVNGLAPVEIPMIRGIPALTVEGPKAIEIDPEFSEIFGRERISNELNAATAKRTIQLVTDEVRARYMQQQGRGSRTYWDWIGDNEIAKTRMQDDFIREFKPRIAAASPRAPFDMWIIIAVYVEAYDFDRGGFPLKNLPNRYSETDWSLGRHFDLPGDFLIVDPGTAEKMASVMGGNRLAHIGILFEVSSIEQLKIVNGRMTEAPGPGLELGGVIVQPRLKSMDMYADPELSRQIYQLH